MPPTGSTMASFGSTARHAFTTAGGVASAGNILIASAPAFRAAKASVGGGDAGGADQAKILGALDDLDIRVRHDDELAAHIVHAVHKIGLQHRAAPMSTSSGMVLAARPT